ncbi:PRA1 family protein [Entamoeba marina]
MSESIPLTSINESQPTHIDDTAHREESEAIPLMENEIRSVTQLEWDLFWGFSVDYEFKCRGVFHRIKYNIEIFKLNYIVLWIILFSSSLLIQPFYFLIHFLIALVFLLIFFNVKSPLVKRYIKIPPLVLFFLFLLCYLVFIFFCNDIWMYCLFGLCFIVLYLHMSTKTSTLELVEDFELDF